MQLQLPASTLLYRFVFLLFTLLLRTSYLQLLFQLSYSFFYDFHQLFLFILLSFFLIHNFISGLTKDFQYSTNKYFLRQVHFSQKADSQLPLPLTWFNEVFSSQIPKTLPQIRIILNLSPKQYENSNFQNFKIPIYVFESFSYL